MTTDPFNPADSAAAITKTPRSPQVKAVKPVVKTVTPVKPQQSNGFPPPGSDYWKQHPLLTEHKDGTVRQWGEDLSAQRNPNLLPQQMIPPPAPIPVVRPMLDFSDKSKGKDNNYINTRDQNKSAAIPEIKSNNYK